MGPKSRIFIFLFLIFLHEVHITTCFHRCYGLRICQNIANSFLSVNPSSPLASSSSSPPSLLHSFPTASSSLTLSSSKKLKYFFPFLNVEYSKTSRTNSFSSVHKRHYRADKNPTKTTIATKEKNLTWFKCNDNEIPRKLKEISKRLRSVHKDKKPTDIEGSIKKVSLSNIAIRRLAYLKSRLRDNSTKSFLENKRNICRKNFIKRSLSELNEKLLVLPDKIVLKDVYNYLKRDGFAKKKMLFHQSFESKMKIKLRKKRQIDVQQKNPVSIDEDNRKDIAKRNPFQIQQNKFSDESLPKSVNANNANATISNLSDKKQLISNTTADPGNLTDNKTKLTQPNNMSESEFNVKMIRILLVHSPTSVVIDRLCSPIWYFVGIVANLLSARVWLSKWARKKNASSSVYLAALAFNDILFLLLHILQEIKTAWGHWSPIDSKPVCGLYHSVYIAVQYLASALVLAFNTERYMAICHPYGKMLTTSGVKRATRVIVVLVMVCGGAGFVQMVFWRFEEATSTCEVMEKFWNTNLENNSVFLWNAWSWVSESIFFIVIPAAICLFNIMVMKEVWRLKREEKKLVCPPSKKTVITNKKNDSSKEGPTLFNCSSRFTTPEKKNISSEMIEPPCHECEGKQSEEKFISKESIFHDDASCSLSKNTITSATQHNPYEKLNVNFSDFQKPTNISNSNDFQTEKSVNLEKNLQKPSKIVSSTQSSLYLFPLKTNLTKTFSSPVSSGMSKLEQNTTSPSKPLEYPYKQSLLPKTSQSQYSLATGVNSALNERKNNRSFKKYSGLLKKYNVFTRKLPDVVSERGLFHEIIKVEHPETGVVKNSKTKKNKLNLKNKKNEEIVLNSRTECESFRKYFIKSNRKIFFKKTSSRKPFSGNHPPKSSSNVDMSQPQCSNRSLATNLTLLTVSFYIIATTLPATIFYSISSFYPEGDLELNDQEIRHDNVWQKFFNYNLLRKIAEEICFSHFACNLFIYLLTSEQFRRTFCHIFTKSDSSF